MTVQEAIEDIRDGIKPIVGGKSLEIAIECMEEVEQYRALGTVEQLEWCKDASHWKSLYKEKLEQYESLGTVEELKEAREKQIAKKPNIVGEFFRLAECSDCHTVIQFKQEYCHKCGNKVDWEEGGTSEEA